MKTRPTVVAVFVRQARLCGLALLLLFASAATLRAQITYLGDIPLPSGHTFILPVNGMPYPTNSVSQVLMTTSSFYTLDPSTNTFTTLLSSYPAGVRFGSSGLATYYSNTTISNSSDFVLLLGVSRQLNYYDLTSGDIVTTILDVAPVPSNLTLAVNADASQVALVNNSQIFQLNPALPSNTNSTLLVSSSQNGGPITNAGDGAYGPNGLFYLLDQANGVTNLESYNLSAGFSGASRLVSSFTVASTLSVSSGLAISPAGHIYIGDGSGGLSEYDLSGDLLGNYTFTGPGTNDGNGTAYLDLDRNGDIFVYTPGTGMHEYNDASAIPEPTTYAAILGIAALGFTVTRRRRRLAA